jgi:hypothetical protein
VLFEEDSELIAAMAFYQTAKCSNVLPVKSDIVSSLEKNPVLKCKNVF